MLKKSASGVRVKREASFVEGEAFASAMDHPSASRFTLHISRATPRFFARYGLATGTVCVARRAGRDANSGLIEHPAWLFGVVCNLIGHDACRSRKEFFRNLLGEKSPKRIAAIGNLGILHSKLLALICSVKCPGNLILQTYDIAKELREA